MKRLATASLLLVIALVSVSAYLRLDNSGIGCAVWPECYGMIGQPSAEPPDIGSTYERLAKDAAQPLSWATPLHRLIASVLGLAIVAMTLMALRLKRDRVISFALLSLTVFLAWLGIYSEGLHSPAVVMGNLAGGFLMLGLLGWLTLRDSTVAKRVPSYVRTWIIAGLFLLSLQIVLGGLTSANFAASACQTLPSCNGSYLPGPELAAAFDLRPHEIGPTGLAIGGAERGDIHKTHRLGAVVATLTILVAGILSFRTTPGWSAALVIVLVITEFSVGIATIVADLPISIAVAHNWLAAMLLLGLLRLLAVSRSQQETH